MKYKLATPQVIYELGKRANQEDAIFPKAGKATEKDRLFILCDGMGGHEAGEVASNCVCETLGEYLSVHTEPEDCFSDDDFMAALNAAYDRLDQQDNGAEKKMGTTLVFLKFHADGCLAAHIGDSRIYHIRPEKKEILYKSRDHSLVNDLFDLGEISSEEMKTSPQKNIITRAMQPNQERRPKADIKHITDIRPGDYFYLCSDGMLEETEDDELLNILCMETDDAEKRRILTEVSKDNRDNHSAYLIRVEAVEEASDKKVTTETNPENMDKSNKKKKTTENTCSENEKKEYQKQITQTSPKKGWTFLNILRIIVFILLLFTIMYLAASYLLPNLQPTHHG